MKNPAYPHQPGHRINELRLVTRSLLLLAVLTGVLYLRVFASSTLSLSYAADEGRFGLLALLFLIAGIGGLLATWRWEGLGGVVAVGAGVGLAVSSYVMTSDYPWLAAFVYGSPFIIAGGLSFICWRQG